MKRMTHSQLIWPLLGFLLALPAWGQGDDPVGDDPGGGDNTVFEIPNPLGEGNDNLITLLNKIIETLLLIAGPIAVIMIIWAGFLYTTSGGKEDQVKKAHKTVLYTVIGLIVLILSAGIMNLVESIVVGG